jgi:hypothetical protein
VDNCPGIRSLWKNVNDWDHFNSDEEYFVGWQQVLRRIKSKYPNLQIMANCIPQNPDDGADRVLELVDHVFFENFFGGTYLRFYLAFGYRAQKMGKGVSFHHTVTTQPGEPEPTLEAYSQYPKDNYNYKHAYFCVFLLTWGEHSHWGRSMERRRSPAP